MATALENIIHSYDDQLLNSQKFPLLWKENLDNTANNNYFDFHGSEVKPNVSDPLEPLYANNKFIKYLQKFDKEFQSKIGVFRQDFQSELRSKLIESISTFLEIDHQAFSIELSEEASLFFTLKYKNFSFYIDQYISNERNSNEDFIITIFSGDNIIQNKSGNIFSIVSSIEFWQKNVSN
ncbi:MAG: hypothetical protein ABI844_11380 [Saprospiraceae bacterium]